MFVMRDMALLTERSRSFGRCYKDVAPPERKGYKDVAPLERKGYKDVAPLERKASRE